MDVKNEENTHSSENPLSSPSMHSPDSKTDEFNFEDVKEHDDVREKFEIIAIKMDIHKNGVLYLKELVFLQC